MDREELIRYSRQLILPDVGMEGQERLRAAQVLLVGAGGLGSPTALYLAACGVGRIGLVDSDVVDLSNLHRQVIHGTSDVGRSKLDSAADRMREINPHVEIIKHEVMLSSANALDIIREYDLVVDGTDNFPTRYLVNDACVLLGKRNIYGSVFNFEGQATVFCAPGGPCYRCLYPEPPPPGLVPSCAEAGVLGVLPGLIGLIQATETVKAIIGIGNSLVGRLLLYDALAMSFREVRVKSDPACPICGDCPTIKAPIDYEQFCGLRSGPAKLNEMEIDVRQLAAMLKSQEPFTLLDVREPWEYEADRIEQSILIPLGDVPARFGELDASQKTVVICARGARSAKACEILRRQGFGDVINVRGGMVDWLQL